MPANHHPPQDTLPVLRLSILPHTLPLALLALASCWLIVLVIGNVAYLPDDAAYALIASTLLNGGVLHVDIQDIHAGYVNFMNAASMAIFGHTMIGMRGLLAALTVIQTGIIYYLFRHLQLLPRFSLAMLFAVLTFVQFPNTTANWYSLFGVVLTIAVLLQWPQRRSIHFLVLGILISGVFLTRQLSGVFLLLGVLTYLFHDYSGERHCRVSRVIMLPLLLICAYYLLGRTNLTTFLLFGAAPIAVCGWIAISSRMPDGKAITMLVGLGIGGLLMLAPLLFYHLWHGSVSAWINDTVVSAMQLNSVSFINNQAYDLMLVMSLENIFSGNWQSVLSGLFWTTLITTPFLLSCQLLIALVQRRNTLLNPLTLLACLYSLVSIHYQIPIYLLYSSALSLLALASITIDIHPRWQSAVAMLLLAICGAAYLFNTNQAVRSVHNTLAGVPTEPLQVCKLGHESIHTTETSCQQYSNLLMAVAQTIPESDATLLAIPANPELNYLSGKPSPVRFYNSSFGLATPLESQQLIARLSANPPAAVVHHRSDKYNAAESDKVIDWAKTHYQQAIAIGSFDLYTRSPIQTPAAISDRVAAQ